jgi:hypothetical protein
MRAVEKKEQEKAAKLKESLAQNDSKNKPASAKAP